MKAELVNIPKKGVCILISDLDLNEFLKAFKMDISFFKNIIFTDVSVIADLIRVGRKIPAIKEVRGQTGWGLRVAKEYIDKYIPHLSNMDDEELANAGDRFIQDHMPIKDFLENGEMEL